VIGEVDGTVVAVSEINLRSGYEKHVNRDLGIGIEMVKELIEQARK